MGPVNWIAVLLAAAAALLLGVLWKGPLLRKGRRSMLGGPMRPGGHSVLAAVVFLFAAVMLGHGFARMGAETLDAKPWLYFMQTGGTALFFVVPAVWLTHTRNGTEPARRLLDCAFWLVAYLFMGLVFWVLG
jgi:hypothetical protein